MVACFDPASADCKMQNFIEADEEHKNGEWKDSGGGGSIHFAITGGGERSPIGQCGAKRQDPEKYPLNKQNGLSISHEGFHNRQTVIPACWRAFTS